MLPSISLCSSSPSVAPPAPQGLPWPLASPARLPGLPLLAPDRRLALDYINLNALFIHPRINSHPSEPLRGPVTAADQSLGQGGAARLCLRPAGNTRHCWSPSPASGAGTPGPPPTPAAAGGRFPSLDPPSARGGLGGVRPTHQEATGKERSWREAGGDPCRRRTGPMGPALPDVSCHKGSRRKFRSSFPTVES